MDRPAPADCPDARPVTVIAGDRHETRCARCNGILVPDGTAPRAYRHLAARPEA